LSEIKGTVITHELLHCKIDKIFRKHVGLSWRLSKAYWILKSYVKGQGHKLFVLCVHAMAATTDTASRLQQNLKV